MEDLRAMPAALEPFLQDRERTPHPFANTLAFHPEARREASRAAVMREPEETESVRLTLPAAMTAMRGVASKSDRPGLSLMQREPEIRQPRPKLLQTRLDFVFVPGA